MALFTIGFGLAFALANSGFMFPEGNAAGRILFAAADAVVVPTVLAVLALALVFPSRLPRNQWGLFVLPALVVAAVATRPLDVLSTGPVGELILFLLNAVFLFSLLLLVQRYPRTRPTDDAGRRKIALMSLALFLWPASRAAGASMAAHQWVPLHQAQAVVVALALVAVLWIRQSVPWQRPGASLASRTGLTMLLVLVVSAVAGAFIARSGGRADFGLPGLARIGAVLLLSYAILRHQLLGIDVRLRWTLVRSVLAATFLGCFFIVTSLADNFLERYGWVLGGVATGLLVFAIYPLQRLAERVGHAAFPHAGPVDSQSLPRRRHLYREAAVAAWADGVLGRKERALLDRLRESLDLPGDEAHRIESDAARRA